MVLRASIFFSLLLVTPVKSEELILDSVSSIPRMFGTPATQFDSLAFRERQTPFSNYILRNALLPGEENPTIVDVTSYKPIVVAQGGMIQTKGIYPGREFLYISDTGKDQNIQSPGKIWKYDPSDETLTKFFESDDLINPKWIFYYSSPNSSDDQLIIADLGEEPIPRSPGNGVGAKVVSIPILSNGSAGPMRILHEGPPFRSPEGVTVIGQTVIVSDWAAGSTTYREGIPNDPYLSGLVFRLPLSGGRPEVIFPDERWVTIIGACQYRDRSGRLFLRLIDIDGGRRQDIDPTFPRSGLVKYLVSEVISEEPLLLSPLQEQIFYEDLPISLPREILDNSTYFTVSLLDGSLFLDLSQEKTFLSADVNRIIIKSPISNNDVNFDIYANSSPTALPPPLRIKVNKDQNGSALPLDNKHAGSVRQKFGDSEIVLSGSVDGTSQSLFIFPPKGGTPAVLWRGSPFKQPMGVQFSQDGSSVYVTDQAAGDNGGSVLFRLPVPDAADLQSMFGERFQ